jgi:hypothetical protein
MDVCLFPSGQPLLVHATLATFMEFNNNRSTVALL